MNHFQGKAWAASRLAAVFLTILLLLSGCAAHGGFKTATAGNTPVTRAGQRHSFPPIVAIDIGGPASAAQSDLKVGFIFNGRVGDFGFTYAQNQGALALIRELGVDVLTREMVPPDEQSMDIMQELIDEGCTVIFSCSFGFMEFTYAMAERNPGVRFFHCSGYMTSDNMSAYFGRMYQMRYLTGIVAGLRTETNLIGYVAAHPIPEVRRGINAFALGVKSVNPDAAVNVIWTNSWLNTGLERDLALELVRIGCDVIAQHQDSLLPQIVAEEEGIWGIGYNSPMGFFSPNAYLTGAVWNWGPYMVGEVRKIIDGTWEASNYWGGLETGIVMLEELTENVAPGTQEAVDEAMRRIISGFDVFTGPIYDNMGGIRVPEGQIMPDSEKLSITWFVDNVTEVGAP
ncbi:MAG: BMP family ABC transporter substrate-binding protein [Defluviitaleaceae bacterium]|nr:BMP family ABC transporter substrate-binding protein [Defluviitaleaceae bacterium]MCL2835432.1 BMP family ABC transporter substrate-binding protein [Defluviitaleaceae bacterium]